MSVVGEFVEGAVRVTVPATSANLGPGYDCLGLALDVQDRLTAEVADDGLHIEVSGEGAGEVPADETHLVVRAMRQGFAALGEQPPGLRLACENSIAHSSGMGSSSAAIVGGLVLARALVTEGEQRLDDRALLRLAALLEGHPDNVAPALLGGFVVSGQCGGQVWAHRLEVSDQVSAVLFVPPRGVSTRSSRALLPDEVTHHLAAANTSRAALLVSVLGSSGPVDPDLLHRATEDFLHQDARAVVMPATHHLVRELRAEGFSAVTSGAGPTVLCFVVTPPGSEPTRTEHALRERCPAGWQFLALQVGGQGACVLL